MNYKETIIPSRLNESLEIIWNALHCYREELIPEGDKQYDDEWDTICTAMAYIEETILTEEN